MRGSLQEQLLKAGLVNKETPSKQNKPPKPKSGKQKPIPNNPIKTEAKAPPVPQAPQVPQARKILADNELEKSIKLKIKQILKDNRVNTKEGEIPYNYTVTSQVKRCYVTQEQLDKLISNELAIVNWNDRSYMIPSILLAELQSLHPDLRYFNSVKDEPQGKSEEDPYKDFPVPDDLNW